MTMKNQPPKNKGKSWILLSTKMSNPWTSWIRTILLKQFRAKTEWWKSQWGGELITTKTLIRSHRIWTTMRTVSRRCSQIKKPSHLSKDSTSNQRSQPSLSSQRMARYRKMSFSMNTSRSSRITTMTRKKVLGVWMVSMRTSLKTMSFMPTLSSRVKVSGKKLSLGAPSYRRIHLLIFVNQWSV